MPNPTNGGLWGVFVDVVGFFLAMVLAFWLMAQVAAGGVSGDDGTTLALALSVPAVWILSLLAHEFGHLIAGVALRLPFLCFAFGPLRILRSGHGFRVRIDAGRATAAYVMFGWPTKGVVRSHWALMIVAGPLTSSMLAAAFIIAIGVALPPNVALPSAFPRDTALAFFRIGAAINVFFMIGTLLPTWVHGLRTDGGVLLDMARGGLPMITNEALHREWKEATGWKEVVARETPQPVTIGGDWGEPAQPIARGMYQEVAALGDDHLVTRHLFLAAVAVLPVERRNALRIDEEAIRARVRPNPSPSPATPKGLYPTPRLIRVADIAASRAMAYGRAVAVADIWFALLCDADSDAATLLHSAGLSLPELRRELAPMDVTSRRSEEVMSNAMTTEADNNQ